MLGLTKWHCKLQREALGLGLGLGHHHHQHHHHHHHQLCIAPPITMPFRHSRKVPPHALVQDPPTPTLTTPTTPAITTTPSPTPSLVEEDERDKLWRMFGAQSPFPSAVKRIMREVMDLEENLGEKLVFGGPHGSLKGLPKVVEEKRHRSAYQHLLESEEKMEHYVARQVACRALGSKGHLCQHCWLVLEDCICPKIRQEVLWPTIKIWLYMHPKDFLRKNNTGKLLWQVLGTEAVNLCICGIKEHEEAMWNCFKETGHEYVWYAYPKCSAMDLFVTELNLGHDFGKLANGDFLVPCLNFVLIDGTWSNSKAMVGRLQRHARDIWGGQFMNCVVLSPECPSLMHTLRPQPSWDKTCTAAAAAQLLRELSGHKEIAGAGHGLYEAADAIELALQHQFDALTGRRLRRGWTADQIIR